MGGFPRGNLQQQKKVENLQTKMQIKKKFAQNLLFFLKNLQFLKKTAEKRVLSVQLHSSILHILKNMLEIDK